MSRPSAVYVHGFKVKIKFKEIVLSDEGHAVSGTFDRAGSEILVSTAFNETHQRSTLLHELIHAMQAYANMQIAYTENDVIEPPTYMLERVLFPVFSDRRNRAFFTFLLGAECE